MNNAWAFLPMRASNDLLGDPEALRARLEEDSYLYFQQVLDPDKVTAVRHEVLRTLAAHGWIEGGYVIDRAIAICKPTHEGLDEYAAAYDDVQKGELFHTLAHDDDLLDLMRQVVGDSVFPHPLKIARISFPEHYEVSTPPHQDYPNNQGTTSLLASWIPLGDCPIDLGPLAILRGSHRWGLLPLDVHPGPGNRQARLPDDMREECRWVTTDFSLGDVLLFPSLTVHAALHNSSEFHMRVSCDFRWQREGEPLTEIVLHPHFQRVTWEDVYAGWESDRYQYYWKDLDYEVVPFEDLLSTQWESEPGTNLHADIGGKLISGELEVTKEEWAELLRTERKWNARWDRRQEKLASALGDRADADTAPAPGSTH